DLHVAVHSSPVQSVVTGDPLRVAEFAAEVAGRGLFARTLTAEGAGHSPQVKPLLPLLRAELAGVGGGKPVVPYYSTVFADPRETPAFEAAYWAAGVRRPVRLMQAVLAAAEDGHAVFAELSPRPLLAGALRATLPHTSLVTVGDFHAQVAATAAAVTPRTSGRVVDVPPSPWRHVRHWAAGRRPPAGHRLLGTHVETPSGHSWSTTLDDLAEAPWRLARDEWHRDGHPVLPLAVVAQLARAAAVEVHGEAELHDVELLALLPLPAQVTLTLSDGVVELAAKNAAGAWTVYGRASLTPESVRARPGVAGSVAVAGFSGAGGVLERIRHAGPDGASSPSSRFSPSSPASRAEIAGSTQMPVPTTLDAKLIVRAWAPTPIREAGPARAWLVLADEGDTRAAHLRSLLTATGSEPGVLVLPSRQLDPDGVQRVMLQTAAQARRGVPIVIATERAQAVLEGEAPDPGPAALRGLVRVLALEHPETRATLVDFDDLSDLVTELACDPACDPAGDAAGDEVAWRGGVRYTARLRRATLPPLPRPARPVTGPGAYVITGGSGRLGRIAARWLAARGATRIILNGRTSAPVDGPTRMITGDLAAPGTAERLVAAATAGGVRLRGVIHAAGILDDRLIADLDPGSLERVWAAKVTGGLRLHEATKGLDLDWWVAYSSAAGLLGSPGQTAYAAANAWLDALCERRRAEGLPAISIGWGTWAGATTALPFVEPLAPEEGLEALEALIQRDLPAGVIKLDTAQAVTLFPAIARMPYFSDFVDTPVTPPVRDLAALPPGEALAAVTGQLKERVAAVLGVEAGWLDESSVLTDLGLDSLAATRLRGVIDYDFGLTIPTAPLLQGGTLGALARTITENLPPQPATAQPATAQPATAQPAT
ncbi:SDR family NAD(P)-dependent oxidoreductase, partial [Nonomuraea zeae]